MHKTFKLILVTQLTWFSAFTQEIKSVSIEDAKIYALENHLNAKIADGDIEIARQKVVETRGMGLPQVEFNGSFNHFINLPVQVIDAKFLNPMAPDGETVSFEAGTKYSSSGVLQVNQLLFNGSYIIGLQAARFFANFQESVANQSKEDIVFNVIQAYELTAVAKSNMEFMDELVKTTEELVEKQQNYHDLGLMLEEDMDQLYYSLLSAKSAQTSASIQYENAITMLKLTMGYPINNTLEISDNPEMLLTKNSLSTGDFHENLTYVILEKQVKLSQFNLKNNQFANLPSLNAFFSQTYNAYRNEFNFFADEKWYPQTVWGLQLNIPIFSGLSRHARTSQAKVRLLKDQLSLDQMAHNLAFQELQLKNNVKGAANKMALQKANVELAEKIYQNAIIKKEIGKGEGISVTQKHSQLIMSQSQYVGSMVELFQAKLSLDKLYNNILPNK